MSAKTLKHELDTFLHTRLTDEAKMELNAWLISRPDLRAWLDVPESKRVTFLQGEAALAAQPQHRAPRLA